MFVALGSQFPDIVDKPLAYVGVVSYGRSLAHSLFTFVLVSVIVWWAVRQWVQRSNSPWSERLAFAPRAYSIGYGSHLIGDAYQFVLVGDFFAARFLVYPLFGVPTSSADEIPPWLRMVRIYQRMDMHPQFGLIIVALAVFVGIRVWAYRHRRSRSTP